MFVFAKETRSNLHLCLRNLTGSNIAGVKLELVVDAPARVFVDPLIEDIHLPSRPLAWGPRTRLPFSMPVLSGISPHGFPKVKLVGAQVIKKGDSSKVVFFPVHLGPEEEVFLDSISIVVTTAQATTGEVRVRWRLTSTSEDGSRDGDLELDFGQSVTISSVLEMADRE